MVTSRKLGLRTWRCRLIAMREWKVKTSENTFISLKAMEIFPFASLIMSSRISGWRWLFGITSTLTARRHSFIGCRLAKWSTNQKCHPKRSKSHKLDKWRIPAHFHLSRASSLSSCFTTLSSQSRKSEKQVGPKAEVERAYQVSWKIKRATGSKMLSLSPSRTLSECRKPSKKL